MEMYRVQRKRIDLRRYVLLTVFFGHRLTNTEKRWDFCPLILLHPVLWFSIVSETSHADMKQEPCPILWFFPVWKPKIDQIMLCCLWLCLGVIPDFNICSVYRPSPAWLITSLKSFPRTTTQITCLPKKEMPKSSTVWLDSLDFWRTKVVKRTSTSKVLHLWTAAALLSRLVSIKAIENLIWDSVRNQRVFEECSWYQNGCLDALITKVQLYIFSIVRQPTFSPNLDPSA